MMILVAGVPLVLLRPVDGVVLPRVVALACRISPGRLGVLDVDDAQVPARSISLESRPNSLKLENKTSHDLV